MNPSLARHCNCIDSPHCSDLPLQLRHQHRRHRCRAGGARHCGHHGTNVPAFWHRAAAGDETAALSTTAQAVRMFTLCWPNLDSSLNDDTLFVYAQVLIAAAVEGASYPSMHHVTPLRAAPAGTAALQAGHVWHQELHHPSTLPHTPAASRPSRLTPAAAPSSSITSAGNTFTCCTELEHQHP
jgi:hypothetical protein